METCKLLRIERTTDMTRGVLTHDGHILCTMLELPWRDNQPDISCIPAGKYTVKPHNSPSHGKCFELTGTGERTHIQIHVANWPKELRGCQAPGMGYLPNGISNSGDALKMLMRKFPDGFVIEIEEA